MAIHKQLQSLLKNYGDNCKELDHEMTGGRYLEGKFCV